MLTFLYKQLIKSYCKRSDVIVNVTFDLVMAQLKKKHAQVEIYFQRKEKRQRRTKRLFIDSIFQFTTY